MPLTTDMIDYGVSLDLPEEFLDLIPTECPECGMPTAIRETFTGLSCTDPRCPVKIASRVVAICKRLGVLGIGQPVAEKFVRQYDVTNPLAILALQYGEYKVYDKSPENLDKSIAQGLASVLAEPLTLMEYITLAHLPGIQNSSASAVFKEFTTLDEAYAEIESGGIPYIQSKLGIDPNTVSLRAGAIYENLLEFKNDLYEAQDLVNIEDMSDKRHVRVCISDSAGAPYLSKRNFMSVAEIEARNYGYHLEFVNSVTRTTEFLVHAGNRITNKYKKAMKYEIPILTGADFLDLLRGKEV